MAYKSPDEWLSGGAGAPGYFKKGDPFGKSITGTIVKTEIRQEQDFIKKTPKFYDDGNPIQQLIITLKTALRDPADPQDDGLRRVFLKARLKNSLREAVEKGGANRLEVGGVLTVTYEGDDPPPQEGLHPSRRYVFNYVSAANANLMAGSAPEAPAAPPPPAKAPVTNVDAAKAALAGLSPEELRAIGIGQ